MNPDTLVRFAYEVATNPQKRGDFVATFAEIIDANAAAVAVEDRQLRWASLLITHGMEPSTIDSYCQYYVGLNPWALRRPPTVGEVRTSDELLSETEFRDTEFYHGWFKPRGWLHASSIIVQATETYRAYLFAVRLSTGVTSSPQRAKSGCRGLAGTTCGIRPRPWPTRPG